MSHIRYTIRRSATYYYNRRVPRHAVYEYGEFIRGALSKDPDEAEAFANRLSVVLEGSRATKINVMPVDAVAVIESFKPRSVNFTAIAEEYLSLKGVDQKAASVAVSSFIALATELNASAIRYLRILHTAERSRAALLLNIQIET